MRISVPQPQLLKTLQMVEHAVNDRTTLPILANVLLESSGQELTFTATDLDVGIQCRFPLSEPVERGAVALPARKLTTVVRELPDEAVVLETKKNHTATLNCGSSSFRIPGLPPEDFPVLPVAPATDGIKLSQAALKQLLVRTSHAMSMEETRFILNGALFMTHKDQMRVVATDGRRLAVAQVDLQEPAKQPFRAIVPSKTVRELERLLQSERDEAASISALKDNQLVFRFGQVSIITRLIEGEFPQYEKVVPAPSKQALTCDRQQLIDAIRRVSLMTTATSQAVVFELEANKLVVQKESSELGSAREEFAIEYSGEPVTIAFNPEFWLDVLKVLDEASVTVEISGADRPAVIRREDFTFIVLPMKVT